jgi:tetratricopeptide (TPR) repeat protein
LGGTLNDNTVLYEYLASHGFVVLSGAFQANDYKYVDLNWDLERSIKDIDFMLNAIKNLPFVDFSKIAAIGQSYGAQAVLGYKTENYSPVSCLISLDNTFDYSIDANPEGFEPLTEKLYKKINNMNVPTLVFAGPTASFKVMDSLKYSDRVYATIKLGHNEYTSLSSFAILKGLQNRRDMDTVWSKYVLINEYCLNFLRWNFFNDAVAKKFILSTHPYLTDVYEIPKGKAVSMDIPEYKDFSSPPTYFQFQKLLKDRNKDIIDKIMQKYPGQLDEDAINNAGYDFMKKDIDFAIYLFQKNVELHPKSWNVFDSLGEAYMIKGEKDLAIKSYKKSIELNPKNDNGLRMLEKLK